METFREDQFKALGLPHFVQDNHSRSARGVVRGSALPVGTAHGQADARKRGSAFLVAVDIRKGRPRWENGWALRFGRKQTPGLGSGGFCAGFCVLSSRGDSIQVHGPIQQQGESGIRWNDPEIGIEWPIHDVELSEKDQESADAGPMARIAGIRQFRVLIERQ